MAASTSNEGVADASASAQVETKYLISKILELEELDTDLYRGVTPTNKFTFPRIFGGQTVSQSLMAASRTVPPSVKIHSLHSYFLRPGDVALPIIYQVQRVRDGTSFCARTVVARQNGKCIFTMTCSFQAPERGYEHQRPMPDVPSPESLLTRQEAMRQLSEDPRLPKKYQKLVRKQLGAPFPVDLRYVQRRDPISPKPTSPNQQIWMKALDSLGDDHHIHECVAAYLSDYSLLECATLPHPVTFNQLQVASLDHSMWFHSSFRSDDWLLYDITSPRSIGARGLCFGHIYSTDGRLVITTAQEGLIRPIEGVPDPAPKDLSDDALVELHRKNALATIFGTDSSRSSAGQQQARL